MNISPCLQVRIVRVLQTVSMTAKIQIGHLVQGQDRASLFVHSGIETTWSVQTTNIVEEILMRCLVGRLEEQLQGW